MLSLAERKKIYQLFSDLFRYPDPLTQADYSQHAKTLSHLLRLDLPADLSQPLDLTTLETAYTGLFINSFGGTPAPPYGSVYLDAGGLLMGESSLRVAECYAEENLNLQGSDEPPDFLATELEFFYYLLDEEQVAAKNGDTARESELKKRQADFLNNYLSPWIPEFCERLAAGSSDPFYSWVGEALRRFCDQEKQRIAG